MRRMAMILVMGVLIVITGVLSGCKDKEEEIIKLEHWYNQVVEMTDKATKLDVLVTEGGTNSYFSIGEQNPVDIGLPYNPQVDAYLSKMVDVLANEATDNMVDIVIASTTGSYADNMWYFIVQSYTDSITGNKVINITGICPVENNNLVAISLGIEDKEENIDTTVIQEMLMGYNLNWQIDDIV